MIINANISARVLVTEIFIFFIKENFHLYTQFRNKSDYIGIRSMHDLTMEFKIYKIIHNALF